MTFYRFRLIVAECNIGEIFEIQDLVEACLHKYMSIEIFIYLFYLKERTKFIYNKGLSDYINAAVFYRGGIVVLH